MNMDEITRALRQLSEAVSDKGQKIVEETSYKLGLLYSYNFKEGGNVLDPPSSKKSKMEKGERDRLLERIRTLEAERVQFISDRGIEKMRFEEMLRDQREEMNKYVLAGMLLMRETIRAKLRTNSTVEAVAMQHTDVGIKALMPYIDTGLLGLNVDSLGIFSSRVAELLKVRKDDEQG